MATVSEELISRGITPDRRFELKGAGAERARAASVAAEADAEPEARKPIRCAHCRSGVTWEDLRIEVDGSHEHTRLNPVDLAFRFGCFSEAHGCVISGTPSTEHTWFTGCAWQYAHCRSCGVHLGWYFTGAKAFFGLVLERLSFEA